MDEILARAGIFQGVEPTAVSALTKQLQPVDFPRGHTVFAEGEPGDGFYLVVEGQVHGGVGQGIGQALCEFTAYDENGQLLTGSYMDYPMPRAEDVPFYNVDYSCQTPCTHNPLGVKGCGEAGAIGSPAAFMNALTDALGVRDLPMPATPERVWRAAQRNA